MKNGALGAAAAAAVVVLSGGFAGAQDAGRSPLSRTLSVEQTAVYDVQPQRQQGGLAVVSWVDRSDYTYAEGENVTLFVKTSDDAYVTILNVDPAGQTTILFPNEYQPDNLVRANRVVQVPDRASLSRIVVTGTTGTELIKVIASTEPIAPFRAQQLAAAGPYQVVSAPGAGRGPQPGRHHAGRRGRRPAVQPPITAPSIRPVDSAEWAVCHQTISTIPALSASRTRSLAVTRTSESGGSVACEESAR